MLLVEVDAQLGGLAQQLQAHLAVLVRRGKLQPNEQINKTEFAPALRGIVRDLGIHSHMMFTLRGL